MELITISEFLHLTRLTERDLLSMMENGELHIAIGDTGQVLIDITAVTPELLAARATLRKSTIDPSELAYIEEQVASEVIRHLEGMIEEASVLAEKWCRQNSTTKSADNK